MDKLENEDVKDAMECLQQVIIKMNPSCEIISSAIVEAETMVGHFDFISPVIDGSMYNLMFIFSLDGKFALGSFNCTRFDMENWLEIAAQMLNRARVVQGKG